MAANKLSAFLEWVETQDGEAPITPVKRLSEERRENEGKKTVRFAGVEKEENQGEQAGRDKATKEPSKEPSGAERAKGSERSEALAKRISQKNSARNGCSPASVVKVPQNEPETMQSEETVGSRKTATRAVSVRDLAQNLAQRVEEATPSPARTTTPQKRLSTKQVTTEAASASQKRASVKKPDRTVGDLDKATNDTRAGQSPESPSLSRTPKRTLSVRGTARQLEGDRRTQSADETSAFSLNSSRESLRRSLSTGASFSAKLSAYEESLKENQSRRTSVPRDAQGARERRASLVRDRIGDLNKRVSLREASKDTVKRLSGRLASIFYTMGSAQKPECKSAAVSKTDSTGKKRSSAPHSATSKAGLVPGSSSSERIGLRQAKAVPAVSHAGLQPAISDPGSRASVNKTRLKSSTLPSKTKQAAPEKPSTDLASRIRAYQKSLKTT